MAGAGEAPVITCAEAGSFARSVLTERHPALVRQVREATPYPPELRRALEVLVREAEDGVITPLPAGAHDADRWTRWSAGYLGRSWFEVPFLWSESYFYRRLLEAVGYFRPGPWQGIDPFAPFKRAELTGPEVGEELAALDAAARLPLEERDQALLTGALWGNKADLGFRISSGDPGGKGEHLVVDESAAMWRHLASAPPGVVCVLADNAGRELIPDLLLVDHLLHTGRAAAVVLHVKPQPYYVSDATTADVLDCVRRIAQAPGQAGVAGGRLRDALAGGRLAVHAHPFSCAPLPYAEMPDDLRADLAQATLTISKGDLNYRRLVGDRLWPGTTAFAGPTSGFPTPVLALRTLKSDVAVGLEAGTLAELDASGEDWRTSGTYAVMQFRA